MPYQGSAQSIGFKARQVADPSRRMRQEAEQIKQQGQQRIQGMETQASQRITEMQRVSDIQSSNADYELKALSKFSSTLSKLAEEQGAKYIEEERAKGMMDYMSRPPEELEEDTKEVDAAYNKGADVHNAMGKLADKAPNVETASAIRHGSRYYKQGWDLAAMNQSAEGFGAHLLAELKSNETLIADPAGGDPFMIKDHEGTAQWEAASQYIMQQYILNNNPAGLSAKVLATKMLPQLRDSIKVQRIQYVTKYLKEQDVIALDGEENALYTALVSKNSPIAPEVAIQTFLTNASKLQDGGFRGARGLVISNFQNIAADNPRRGKELASVIANTKIAHPSAKGGQDTLANIFGDEFSIATLESIADDAAQKQFTQRQQGFKRESTEAYQATLASFREKTPSETTKRALADAHLLNYGTTEEGRRHAAAIRDYTPMYLDRETSQELADQYQLINPGGNISEEQAKNFDQTVYSELKRQGIIVDKLFGADSKSAVEDGQDLIDAALYKALKNNTQLKRNSVQFEKAQAYAHRELMNTAAAMLRDGRASTEAEAISMAADDIVVDIQRQQPSYQGSAKKEEGKYTSKAKSGMQYFNPKDADESVAQRQSRSLRQLKTNLQNAPIETVIRTSFVQDEADLELAPDGRPASFFYTAAGLTGGRYSAYDILNFQRQAKGELPLDPPEEVKTIDEILKERPDLRAYVIANPTPRNVSRVVEQVGGISPPNVLKAIGFKESSGNYKARNDDPLTGNDKDPALGKYQILWSNVRAWGQKYKLGVPESQNAYLNNPRYQDELANAAISDYIQRELQATGGDVDLTIRRVAAWWYGGNPDVYNSENYGAVGPYPSMREYTNAILHRYKGGY